MMLITVVSVVASTIITQIIDRGCQILTTTVKSIIIIIMVESLTSGTVMR